MDANLPFLLNISLITPKSWVCITVPNEDNVIVDVAFAQVHSVDRSDFVGHIGSQQKKLSKSNVVFVSETEFKKKEEKAMKDLIPVFESIRSLQFKDVVKKSAASSTNVEGLVYAALSGSLGLIPAVLSTTTKSSPKGERIKVIPADAAEMSDVESYEIQVMKSNVWPYTPDASNVPADTRMAFEAAFNSGSCGVREKYCFLSAYKAASERYDGSATKPQLSGGGGMIGFIFVLLLIAFVAYLGFSSEQYEAQLKGKLVNYYEVLDIPRTATEDQIKEAFRKQTRRWHPDKNPGCGQECQDKMALVQEAYRTLSYPQTRTFHDLHGVAPPDAMFKKEQSRHGGRQRKRD
eukprot:PhF_6_TR29332/c0_g1_i2/m.43055